MKDIQGVAAETIHTAIQIGRKAEPKKMFTPTCKMQRYDMIMVDEASQVDDKVNIQKNSKHENM